MVQPLTTSVSASGARPCSMPQATAWARRVTSILR